MGVSSILFRVASAILVLEYVWTREIFDDKIKDHLGHLKKIPRKFEIRAENAIADFKKYVTDIQDLTAGKHLNLIYKIKVEIQHDIKKMNKKKVFKKSKKYNVPLKKQSMRLSKFEVLLRKLAEENGQKPPNYESFAIVPTIKPVKIQTTTRQIQMKYKPVMRHVRTNFTKIIKPVKSKIITLTV